LKKQGIGGVGRLAVLRGLLERTYNR
jgi:hypothetical protein